MEGDSHARGSKGRAAKPGEGRCPEIRGLLEPGPRFCVKRLALSLRMALPPNLPHRLAFSTLGIVAGASPESTAYTCIQVETICVSPRSNISGRNSASWALQLRPVGDSGERTVRQFLLAT